MEDALSLPDRRWAMWAGILGIAGIVCYGTLSAVDVPVAVGVLLTFGFAFGFGVSGIGLHFGVTRRVAPALGTVAAVMNVVAVGELVAMLLVQMAVRATVAHPGKELIAVWLGLDVAWDLFAGTGIVLFGIALALVPGFSRLLGAAGVALALALLVLNIATFPTPPAEAESIDLGPFVALWYAVAMTRVLVMSRRIVRA